MRIKNVIVTGILKVLQRINIEDLTVNQLNGLSTSELDSLSGTISNIQEQIQYVRNTVLEADSKARTFKSTIANDINSVVKSDVLDVDSEMSEFSDTIKNSVAMATSDATATADKILVDYNAYVNGKLIEGSMPNRGDASVTSNYVVREANQSTSVNGIISSNGYYNSITINPIVIELEDYTQGNATADKIASGYSAWVNGLKVFGSLPQLGGDVFGSNGSPTCFDESPIVSSAYNSYVGAFDYPLYGWFPKGNHRVHIPNLIPANIKAGVKVGSANGYILGSYTSDANATADKIVSGYSAYVNGNRIDGGLNAIGGPCVEPTDVRISDTNIFVGIEPALYTLGSADGFSGMVSGKQNIIIALSLMATKLGLTGNKIIKGNTICGVSGTAATYNEGVNDTKKGTAVAADVLTGKTFTNSSGVNINGTLTDYGSEPQAGGITEYNGGLYLYIPDYSTNPWGSGKIQRGIYTPLSNLGNVSTSNVLSGNTFTSSAGLGVSGTMPNKGSTTVDASAVTSDSNYTYLTIPANGYYNTESKVRTPNSSMPSTVYELGSGKSFDVSSYSGYQNFTVQNFIISKVTFNLTANNNVALDKGGYSVSGTGTITGSYNSSTGIFKVSASGSANNSYVYAGCSIKSATVYLRI